MKRRKGEEKRDTERQSQTDRVIDRDRHIDKERQRSVRELGSVEWSQLFRQKALMLSRMTERQYEGE